MAIVTISRGSGSLGEDIGKAVAGKLGYEYVGKDLILKEIQAQACPSDKWAEWGREMDEHGPSVWERFDRSFTGFVALVESAIYSFALKDNKVIMGRGANWLLRDVPYALRVRIVAPMEERIKRVSDREHVNKETARRMIEFSDHERASYLHAVYRKDGSDPEDYDMVFDTGKLGVEEVVGLIVDAVPAREKQATPQAREKIHQLALAARVKAAVNTDLRTFVPTLEVVHDGSGVVLRGIVHSEKEQKLVLETAKITAGSTPVRSELHYRGT